MNTQTALKTFNQTKKQRFVALDLLRGFVVVLLIIVENQFNGWWFIDHAGWIGFHLADLTFGAFMVCMGLSMAFSLKHTDKINKKFVFKTVRRGVLLIAFGFILNFLISYFNNLFQLQPNAFIQSITHLRVYGVFQRLGFVSLVCSFIIVLTKKDWRWLLGISGAIIVAYFFILGFGHGYEASENNIVYVFDHLIWNAANLYPKANPIVGLDPEGGLSTLPCIAQVLICFVISKVYLDKRNENKKDALILLFEIATIALLLGAFTNIFCPIIKKVWTPTYVFITTGITTMFYSLFIVFTRNKAKEKYFYPLKVLGMNAMMVYIFMHFVTFIFTNIPVGLTVNDGVTTLINIQHYIASGLTTMCIGNAQCASLIYSLLMVVINWFIAWILYKKRIFIKL